MSKFQDIQAREGGLKRELSGPQITMIALGGAIGTGLFLGSRLAIGHAVRYTYWLCIVLAVGTEVTAIGEYFSYWFPGVPQLVWVIQVSFPHHDLPAADFLHLHAGAHRFHCPGLSDFDRW